jgi:tRNA(fMet)-specific endonuclease VapC
MKPAIPDSDTLSYFLKGNPVVMQKVDTYLQAHGFVHLSVITYYEILNGLLFKDAQSQLARFQQFIHWIIGLFELKRLLTI